MEKRGIISPQLTPQETGDAAQTVARVKNGAASSAEERKAIQELDGDFRKQAAEATRKSLR